MLLCHLQGPVSGGGFSPAEATSLMSPAPLSVAQPPAAPAQTEPSGSDGFHTSQEDACHIRDSGLKEHSVSSIWRFLNRRNISPSFCRAE